MSPTLARAHYSCPDNAIGLVSTGQAVEGSLAEFFLLLPMFMLCLQCFDAVGWAAGRASGL